MFAASANRLLSCREWQIAPQASKQTDSGAKLESAELLQSPLPAAIVSSSLETRAQSAFGFYVRDLV